MKDNVKLGTLGDIFIGLTYRPEDVANEGTIVLRSSNIQNGRLDFNDIVRVKCKVRENLIVKPNDILMCSRNGSAKLVGKCTLLPEMDEEMSFGAFMTIIRTQHNPYLLHFFNSNAFRCQLGSAATTTINQITRKMLDDISVPLYPKEQEDYIVSVFNQIDELIWTETRKLALFDELVKSRFIELFDGKGYPELTIGELVASKVSSVKKAFASTDTIKYIDISSIDNKRNVMTGYTEYVLEEAPSRAQQHIKRGDIVVSTVRPNLKNVAITGYEYDNLVASSGFCVLRAEKCLPAYLMAVVCSDDFTDAMTKVVTGANYPAIKDSDVRSYVVPNPPIELQEQFSAFVEQTDKSKLAVQKSIAELEELKKSLMQKYFG